MTELERALLRERMTGMPRWRVNRPAPNEPIVPDSDVEIARRRKVIEDIECDYCPLCDSDPCGFEPPDWVAGCGRMEGDNSTHGAGADCAGNTDDALATDRLRRSRPMVEASVLQEPSTTPQNTVTVHPQVCPLCGVRATQWQPRIVSGVLLVRMRCWEGHDWSLTAVVNQ